MAKIYELFMGQHGLPSDVSIFNINLNSFHLKVRILRFGPISKSEISGIKIDCWLHVSESVLNLKVSQFGPILNTQISGIYKLDPLPALLFLVLKLTSGDFSLNQWFIWRCLKLSLLPSVQFLTLKLFGDYLSLNQYISEGVCMCPNY